MPKYVIERNIPSAGTLSTAQLQAASQNSCGVLRNMGPQIQWVQSYVTSEKIYCVYIAPSEELVLEHATRGGFPANVVSEITTVIDPVTARHGGHSSRCRRYGRTPRRWKMTTIADPAAIRPDLIGRDFAIDPDQPAALAIFARHERTTFQPPCGISRWPASCF